MGSLSWAGCCQEKPVRECVPPVSSRYDVKGRTADVGRLFWTYCKGGFYPAVKEGPFLGSADLRRYFLPVAGACSAYF